MVSAIRRITSSASLSSWRFIRKRNSDIYRCQPLCRVTATGLQDQVRLDTPIGLVIEALARVVLSGFVVCVDIPSHM